MAYFLGLASSLKPFLWTVESPVVLFWCGRYRLNLTSTSCRHSNQVSKWRATFVLVSVRVLDRHNEHELSSSDYFLTGVTISQQKNTYSCQSIKFQPLITLNKATSLNTILPSTGGAPVFQLYLIWLVVVPWKMSPKTLGWLELGRASNRNNYIKADIGIWCSPQVP